MKCPFCSSEKTKVIDKRKSDLNINRRRRECLECKKRFTTYERVEEAPNTISMIQKRDGKVAEFDQNKITEAIFKAAKAVGGKDRKIAETLSSKVSEILKYRFKDGSLPNVEDVQDVVEYVLIENGHAKTAKAFILYREKHRAIRELKSTMVDVEDTIGEYLHKTDWRVKENSNEQYSFSGLLLHISGKVIANYALTKIYTPQVADAYKKGYIHVHDLSHGFIGYSFYRNEAVVVRQKGENKMFCLGLEQLYELVNAPVIVENGFEIKYTTDYEILDETGWTSVQRVLRHKSEKPLISFNTEQGNNLIVTDDHPFIILQDAKETILCPDCGFKSVIKNRTNKTGKDYYKCKTCKSGFGVPIKDKIDINKRKECLAKDVSIKNCLITPAVEIPKTVDSSALSAEDGWFIGLFVADGYFWKNYVVFEFNQNSPEVEKLVNYLESNSVNYNSFIRKDSLPDSNLSPQILETPLQGKMSVAIHFNNFSPIITSLISQIRPYSENKNLPIEFIGMNDAFVGGLISGVIDGDGTVRNDDKWVSRANIRVTSKTLLSQIQFWLTNKKIKSSLISIDSYGERRYQNRSIISKKQLYSLTFSIPEKKKDLFSECIKIDLDFKYSKGSPRSSKLKDFSSLRKIESIKNDSEYVYDITTSSRTFICNGVLAHNCAGWSLKNLLLWGFGGVKNKVDAKPAKHMSTVVHQMVNYIGCLQMEFAGAQAFSSVDTLLAPFIKADNLSYGEVKQAMQQLVYSLNIPSRWGSQYPFSNLTFDWTVPDDMKDDPAIVGGKEQKYTYGELQKEMDMINKAFIEVMLEGDAYGRIFSFPIPTYNLTKNFDWEGENAKLLFEMTAKYGTPYFQNYVGSDLEPKSIRSMCCRLSLDMNELIKRPGHIFAAGDSTGSLGVVTMNLNRMAYEAKTKEEFFEKLKYYMGIAKDSLEIKREVVNRNMENGLMPYTKRYLGTFQNHFSTIGLCGMNEACLNLIGKDISTEEGKQLAIETLEFMRSNVVSFQRETGSLYNLEATPAESTSYRFAKLDKAIYPDIITAGEKEPFLTNSTQLPVNFGEDVIAALEHQNDIQHLYTGGTIFHTFLGESMSSGESCKELVKKIAHNTRIPYFSITPTFSVCPEHGYLKGENHTCTKNGCEKECEVYSRIVGYFRPVKNWNIGKQEEFKFRTVFDENKAFSRPINCIKNGVMESKKAVV